MAITKAVETDMSDERQAGRLGAALHDLSTVGEFRSGPSAMLGSRRQDEP
jgi:hypothetical protein